MKDGFGLILLLASLCSALASGAFITHAYDFSGSTNIIARLLNISPHNAKLVSSPRLGLQRRMRRCRLFHKHHVMGIDENSLDRGISEMRAIYPNVEPEELVRFLRKRKGDARAATAMYAEYRTWLADTLPVRLLQLYWLLVPLKACCSATEK